MNELQDLIDNNERWAAAIKEEDPDFFAKLARQQTPEFLWIGCSDARVPANEIVGMLPGDLFVHRNVANVVLHTDLNCLSVIQYAVDVLKVKHILVTGHYGCGGVRASMQDRQFGLIDGWLRSIRDLYYEKREELAKLRHRRGAGRPPLRTQRDPASGQRRAYQHCAKRLAPRAEPVDPRLHLRHQGWPLEKPEHDHQRFRAIAAAVPSASGRAAVKPFNTDLADASCCKNSWPSAFGGFIVAGDPATALV